MNNIVRLHGTETSRFDTGTGEARSHKPTLIVNFHFLIDQIIKTNPDANFDESFFASDLWPDRPNSGQRLSLVNYQAFRALAEKIEIHTIYHLELPEDVSRLFDNYSTVVILQAPNPAAKKTLNKILTDIQLRPTRARIIFGTEVTWFADLDAERFTRDQIKEIYTRHTLLRHTARTDLRAYADEKFDNAVIQEFEIGVDCDVVRPETPVAERKKVLFVRAPEGRQTKNNEGIDEIVAAIQDTPALCHLDVNILEPPYSTLDYWKLLQECRYLLFTSNGETFSYVLNDAKASGVISFFPARMYENRLSGSVVDSYPDTYGRYSSVSELIGYLIDLESNPEAVRKYSRLSRSYVVDNFSVPKVAENWLDVILDAPLNNRRVMFARLGTAGWSLQEALERCRATGCNYLIPYLNYGIEEVPDTGYSWFDPESGVTIVKDFLYETSDTLRYTKGAHGKASRDQLGTPVARTPMDELLRFWRLLTRVNKIGEIYTNLHPSNEVLAVLRTDLTVRVNSKKPFAPIHIKHLQIARLPGWEQEVLSHSIFW